MSEEGCGFGLSDEMVLVVEGERPPLTSNGERPVGEDVLVGSVCDVGRVDTSDRVLRQGNDGCFVVEPDTLRSHIDELSGVSRCV